MEKVMTDDTSDTWKDPPKSEWDGVLRPRRCMICGKACVNTGPICIKDQARAIRNFNLAISTVPGMEEHGGPAPDFSTEEEIQEDLRRRIEELS